MDIIESIRRFGVELQKEPRFIAYAKAKLALDADEALQEKIGAFNVARMNIDRMLEKEEKNDVDLSVANAELRHIYDSIMENESMKVYNEAKMALDKLMSDITAILQMSAEGADPMTAEIPTGGCSGNCSGCSGCH